MEEQTETIEKNAKNMFVPICITQAICVVVILIAVLIIKFFFDGSYIKLQDWCHNNFLEQTKTTTVFDEESDS